MTGNPPERADAPCERCRYFTPDVFLERAQDGSLCCPACIAEEPPEPDEDADDSDEPHCACRSYCNACTPGVERWI